MLNRHSMPVWMLADSLLGLLVAGGMITTGGLVVAALCLPDLNDAQTVGEEVHLAREVESEAEQLLASERVANVRLNSEIAELKDQSAKQEKQVDQLQGEVADLQTRQTSEKAVRRELLSLKGDFERTMFVIDISGSMGVEPQRLDSLNYRPNWGPGETPWQHVRQQIDTWLRHLPVESFRVICFNHELHEFPEAERRWISGTEARLEASAYLNSLEVGGFTYTELALERAKAWQPTTIILLTDGAPSNAEGHLEPEQQARILARVVQDDWNVPVNVIALNDYMDGNLGPFLQQLAGRTGGGFMGL